MKKSDRLVQYAEWCPSGRRFQTPSSPPLWEQPRGGWWQLSRVGNSFALNFAQGFPNGTEERKSHIKYAIFQRDFLGYNSLCHTITQWFCWEFIGNHLCGWEKQSNDVNHCKEGSRNGARLSWLPGLFWAVSSGGQVAYQCLSLACKDMDLSELWES